MASFSVVNNISAVNAQAKLYETNVGLQKTLGRLSSGLRINQSADDAAGLAVANKYRSDVAILTVGVRNANDGVSRLQIVDGALNNISNLLDRAAVLASQSASEGNAGLNRTVLNDEFASVMNEVNREAAVANLAGAATSFTIFVSSEGTAANGQVSVAYNQIDTTALGLTSNNISSSSAAQTAITALSAAITSLGTVQGQVGSAQNRLQFAISLAQSQVVNKTAAEGRIRDANMAEESSNLTRYNILTQSGLASLAQSNQASSAVLALLR
jgi:flagellin